MICRIHGHAMRHDVINGLATLNRISQRKLAYKADLNQATVSRALAGNNCRYTTQRRIQQAMESLVNKDQVDAYVQQLNQTVHQPTQNAQPDPPKPEETDTQKPVEAVALIGFPLDKAYKFVDAARKAFQAEQIDTTISLRGLINMAQIYALLAEKHSLKPEHALSGAFHLVASNQVKDQARHFYGEMFQTCFGFNVLPMSKVLTPMLSKGTHQHPLEPVLETLVRARYHTWNYGVKGCGKTRAIYETAKRTHNGKIYRIQGTRDRTVDDLVGGRGAASGTTHYEYGPLALAVRDGALFVLDEISALGSEVLFELHSVLEGNPLTLAKNRGEVLEVHQNFVVAASDNTIGQGEELAYIGTSMVNEALRDRFVFLEWDFMPKERELKAVKAHLNLFKKADYRKLEPGTALAESYEAMADPENDGIAEVEKPAPQSTDWTKKDADYTFKQYADSKKPADFDPSDVTQVRAYVKALQEARKARTS